MPTFDKILQESQQFNPFFNLQRYLENLAKITSRPALAYLTAYSVKPGSSPESQAIVDADMQGFMTCMKGIPKNTKDSKIDLIMHSPGGSLEATKRIIFYLRKLFLHMRVFIPHLSMSGGTMISLAADEIWMGPYSSLGPTDPQVPLGDRFVPVGAIIKEFERAKEDVKKDPSSSVLWNERLKDLPFGMLQSVVNSYEHAPRDTEEILLKYMFSKTTADAKDKAKKIAEHLNAYDQHSHHSKGINLDKARELGLNVFDLSSNKELEDAVLSIYHASTILFRTTPLQKVILNSIGSAFAIK
jgi:membrane-bound ClpP family serine protease